MRYLLLHNIRSEQNVGAIFRTAEGAGVAKIYLAGYTPRPIDRFGRLVPTILKTALGATDMVPWEIVEDIVSCISTLKSSGCQIVAIEQTPQSISLYDFVPARETLYIVGNEVSGVPEEISALADVCVEIPMAGQKESLNVSVATGIALFHTPADFFGGG